MHSKFQRMQSRRRMSIRFFLEFGMATCLIPRIGIYPSSIMSHLRTADGSFTYISPIFKETYHSQHGAVSESQHVFIEAGLDAVKNEISDRPLHIFEMGMGSGLNALLTLREAEKESDSIHYHTLEAYPISPTEIDGFQISTLFDSKDAEEQLRDIHLAEWDDWIPISPHFTLRKEQADFTSWNPPKDQFHLIYYDAFAPRAQSELWSTDITTKLFQMLRPGGVLVTYCAQGQFKRNLKAAGFTVEPLPGPKGKREMTRARKPG